MSKSSVENTSRAASGTAGRRPGWLIPVIGLGAILIVLALTYLNQRANPSGATPISTLSTRDFHALLFSPIDANVVFFGHHDGLLVSDDLGATWRPTSLQGADAMSLAAAATRSGRVYAAGHGVLYSSDDAGATWAPVPGALAGADIHAFAVNPDDDKRVYAFVAGQGFATSDDGGTSWNPLPSSPSDEIIALAAASRETLFTADAAGNVYQSDDGGGVWRSINIGGGMQVTSLAFDTRSGALYATAVMAGMNKAMIHRLTPAATSWENITYPGSGTPIAIAVSPHDGQTLLVINARGLVYRSRDGGKSWR
jgi:photosystem II stability/assembly factor-like uncharacterized protein